MNKLKASILIITILSIFGMLTSCKDDSASSDGPFIEITDATVTLFGLNVEGCNFGGDEIGSAFLFEIDFDASPDIEIDGIEYDLSFVDGADFPNTFIDDFDLTNGGLEFIRCFRFEETEGAEVTELKILANDESIESNEVSISIERPEGANKRIH